MKKILALALLAVTLLAGCRWYTGASPFYTTVPQSPSVHPNSANAMAHFLDHGSVVVAWKRWSVTLFTANENTPRRSVQVTRFHFGGYNWLDNVPVPANAVPDSGGDGHMSVSDGTCIYDWFEADVSDPNNPKASWINRMPINSDGIYDQGASSRGSGFANLQGLMEPGEFDPDHGSIDHALMFSYHSVKSGGPVFPATESDGTSTASWAIPEGARLYLPSTFDLSGYPLWQQRIGEALKEYGMYLGDVGGASAPSLYAINPLGNGSNQNPYPWGSTDYPTLPNAMMSALKVENYGSQTASQYTPIQGQCGSNYR